jgi:hypothetical protein
MAKRGAFLILFLLCVPISLSLGLQYGRIDELFFESNMQYTKEFTIIGYSEGMGVTVSVNGALAEYAELSELIDFEGGKKVNLTINFPETLSPGIHSLIIMAKEIPIGGTGTISVVIETGKEIKFWALDPGKFALFDFSTGNLNVNESVDFTISASSYGEQTINDIYGVIEILFNNEIVKTIESEHINLESKGKKSFKAEFDATGLVPGDYVARAKISWDGNETIIEREFRIGSLNLQIINFTREVTKSNIAEMFVEIESKWNNDVKDVNAEVFIGDILVGTSLDYDIDKWGKVNVPVYVNLKNIEVGEHNIEIVLNYESESSFLIDKINVLEPPKEIDWMRIGLMSVIAILLISLLYLWIITFKKKK